MGPIGVCALFQRLRAGDRGNRRPYGRGPGPGRGSGQPRPAGPKGPVRLAGQPRGRPADPAAGPRGRRAGRGRLGHRHGPDRPAYPPPAGHSWPGLDRVLHFRAAVLRGVLHPWGDWEGRAGHPHMDGNTRLCTATAAQALKETFGTDGQPGSYTDIDHADTILHFGHNIAEAQTVLWMRILDRRRGPNPPRLVVVDPRPTRRRGRPTCTWRSGPGPTWPC